MKKGNWFKNECLVAAKFVPNIHGHLSFFLAKIKTTMILKDPFQRRNDD